jgi:hypothetical protein
MKLYIKVVNGIPVNNPLFEENLLEAFPDGIPTEYELFERIQPNLSHGVFQKLVNTYVKNQNNTWTDNWAVVEITDAEKQIRTEELRAAANRHVNDLKNAAANAINYLTDVSDLVGVQVWTDYLSKLNLWVLESIDPVVPSIPPAPYKDDTENWVPSN